MRPEDAAAASPPGRGRGTLGQLRTVGRVVVALALREMKTRFGTTRLGYLWAIAEPAIYVLLFLGLRTAISDATPFGTSIVLFMMTGLLVVRTFVSVANGLTHSVSANRALLTYPPVKPNDVIFARFLVQALVMYLVLFLFFLALSQAVEFDVIVNPGSFFAALAAVTLLAGGIGTFNAVVSVLMPFWGKLWGVMSLPIFVLSGIFYLPRSLPPFAQDILQWNPVLHCVEWMRMGTYLTYDPLLDRFYVLAFGATALALGLVLERIYRFRLLSA